MARNISVSVGKVRIPEIEGADWHLIHRERRVGRGGEGRRRKCGRCLRGCHWCCGNTTQGHEKQVQ